MKDALPAITKDQVYSTSDGDEITISAIDAEGGFATVINSEDETMAMGLSDMLQAIKNDDLVKVVEIEEEED